MSSIVINGDTSGSVTLQAPTVAGSTVVTLPTTSMNIGTGGGSVATNTAFGTSALAANTTGSNSVAVGYLALNAQTTNFENNAFGSNAGKLTTSSRNNFFGYEAGRANTSGADLCAIGHAALSANTTGGQNTALGGGGPLNSNTTGSSNTGLGHAALYSNTTASNNTAVGYKAAYANTTGTNLVCLGIESGTNNTTGQGNTFIGRAVGLLNTTGSYNCFVGQSTSAGESSGFYMTTGSKNTILGGYNGNQGSLDIRTSSNNIVLSDGDGNPRVRVDASGYLYSPGTYLLTTGSAANMFVATDGSFQRSTSALKYKQDIRDLEELDISTLRPVRYKSKCERDDQTKDHFGVIADEVHEAGITELVSYGATGEVEGFQYERLTVVLLKALQEQQALITSLTTRITALEAQVGA